MKTKQIRNTNTLTYISVMICVLYVFSLDHVLPDIIGEEVFITRSPPPGGD